MPGSRPNHVENEYAMQPLSTGNLSQILHDIEQIKAPPHSDQPLSRKDPFRLPVKSGKGTQRVSHCAPRRRATIDTTGSEVLKVDLSKPRATSMSSDDGYVGSDAETAPAAPRNSAPAQPASNISSDADYDSLGEEMTATATATITTPATTTLRVSAWIEAPVQVGQASQTDKEAEMARMDHRREADRQEMETAFRKNPKLLAGLLESFWVKARKLYAHLPSLTSLEQQAAYLKEDSGNGPLRSVATLCQHLEEHAADCLNAAGDWEETSRFLKRWGDLKNYPDTDTPATDADAYIQQRDEHMRHLKSLEAVLVRVQTHKYSFLRVAPVDEVPINDKLSQRVVYNTPPAQGTNDVLSIPAKIWINLRQRLASVPATVTRIFISAWEKMRAWLKAAPAPKGALPNTSFDSPRSSMRATGEHAVGAAVATAQLPTKSVFAKKAVSEEVIDEKPVNESADSEDTDSELPPPLPRTPVPDDATSGNTSEYQWHAQSNFGHFRLIDEDETETNTAVVNA